MDVEKMIKNQSGFKPIKYKTTQKNTTLDKFICGYCSKPIKINKGCEDCGNEPNTMD